MYFIAQIMAFSQDVLTDCFYDNATGTYNANLHTLTVSLTPTQDYTCQTFPSGIIISVKAFELNHNIMAVLDSYQYTVNNTLLLENVDFGGVSPQYVQLNISCVTQYTLVDLAQLNYQLSALDQCFEKGTSFRLMQAYISLTVVPSGACTIQMQYLKKLDITYGTYTTSILLQQTTNIDLDGATLPAINSSYLFPHYQVGKKLSFFVQGDFTVPMQQIHLSVEITFAMQIDQLLVVTVCKPNELFIGSLQPTFSTTRVLLTDDGLTLVYSLQSNVINTISTTDYSEVIFRLSAKSATETITLQKSFPTYGLNQIMINFKSNNWTAAYNKLKKSSTIQVDISVIKDSVLLSYFVQYTDMMKTSWDFAYGMIQGDKLLVDVTKEGDALLTGSVTSVMRFIDDAGVFYQLLKPISLTSSQTRFEFDCSTECKTNFQKMKTNMGLFIVQSANGSLDGVPVLKFINGDYNTVQITALVVGVIVGVLCISVIFYEIYKFSKTLKMMKLKQKSNKHK